MMKTCEMCQKDRPNCGPFRDSKTGQKWSAVCGGCKIQHVLSDPECRARLAADIRAVAPLLTDDIPVKA